MKTGGHKKSWQTSQMTLNVLIILLLILNLCMCVWGGRRTDLLYIGMSPINLSVWNVIILEAHRQDACWQRSDSNKMACQSSQTDCSVDGISVVNLFCKITLCVFVIWMSDKRTLRLQIVAIVTQYISKDRYIIPAITSSKSIRNMQ